MSKADHKTILHAQEEPSRTVATEPAVCMEILGDRVSEGRLRAPAEEA